MSMKGERWDKVASDELEAEDDDSDTELDAEQARCYLAIAARLNYIRYAVKESARNMSNP